MYAEYDSFHSRVPSGSFQGHGLTSSEIVEASFGSKPSTDPKHHYNAAYEYSATRFNILTLGGSVTWGADLESEEEAYPHIIYKLGNHKVTNKAIQASSSFYPSICLESLMKGDDTNYDIIVLEFSLGGFKNFDTLVKRLQYRYPHASLVYVHLYSLRNAVTSMNGNIDWSHKELTVPGVAIQGLFHDIGGYIYSLPAPDDPSLALPLFTAEKSHLSVKGHRQVGEDLSKLIENFNFGTPAPHKHQHFENNWGYGDECTNWFISGHIPYNFRGGRKKQISFQSPSGLNKIGNGGSVLEFKEKGNNSITIRNNLKARGDVPVFFSYVIPAHEKFDVDITMNGSTMTLQEKSAPFPRIEMAEVGMASAGLNPVNIKLKNGTEVFHLVGVAFYGFRYHQDLPMKKMHNTIEIKDASNFLV